MGRSVVSFTKMHGAGNDYIYVDATRHPLPDPAALSMKWSAPHTGIGADGLVLIGTSEVGDFSMRIFNADGSEALMCGNATRCVAKYVYDKKLTDKTAIALETRSGLRHLQLHLCGNVVDRVSVDMGHPRVINAELLLDCGPLSFLGAAVSMGNPHFVVFVPDAEAVDLAGVGPLIEHNPFFEDRTNVEFAHITATNEIRMRVWERGSGHTQACGTGACATAVAAMLHGHVPHSVRVHMDGGSLDICWCTGGSVWMTGDAVSVFEGTIEV